MILNSLLRIFLVIFSAVWLILGVAALIIALPFIIWIGLNDLKRYAKN